MDESDVGEEDAVSINIAALERSSAMPAKSIAERQFFAICEHDPQHARGKCPDMTKAQMHDFAATSEKGLPQKKGRGPDKKKRKKPLSSYFGGR